MRAWTVVLFILAIHACLAMFNHADVLNYGTNIVIDTTSKDSIVVGAATVKITVPESVFFNEKGTGSDIIKGGNDTILNNSGWIGEFITSTVGVAGQFFGFIKSVKDIVFSIHTLCGPLFGDFDGWVLEGMTDFILFVALFQMVTGRSFKTME